MRRKTPYVMTQEEHDKYGNQALEMNKKLCGLGDELRPHPMTEKGELFTVYQVYVQYVKDGQYDLVFTCYPSQDGRMTCCNKRYINVTKEAWSQVYEELMKGERNG